MMFYQVNPAAGAGARSWQLPVKDSSVSGVESADCLCQESSTEGPGASSLKTPALDKLDTASLPAGVRTAQENESCSASWTLT